MNRPGGGYPVRSVSANESTPAAPAIGPARLVAPGVPAGAVEPGAVDARPGGRAGPAGGGGLATVADLAPPLRQARLALEVLAILASALVLALVLKVAVVQAFVIPSLSMHPTLEVGDRVLVDKLPFHDEVRRGDVVVFRPPPGSPAFEEADMIKRVIGLPGDEIAGRAGVLFVNGEAVEEPWLARGTYTGDFGPVIVADDELFVMGDNRSASFDSRRFGPIKRDLFVGRAFVRWWPLSRFGGL
jgi:signal peptidase I